MTIQRTAPLTFSQESLWFFHQMEPESWVYHRGFLLKITGPLAIDVFEKSLNRVVERHEPLRTTIDSTDEKPVQVIHAFAPVQLSIIDLPGIPGEERANRADALLRAGIKTRIALASGLVWRMELLRFSAEEHYLLFWVHHIFFDGSSWTVLIKELLACYEAFSRGNEPVLPVLPLSYSDFAVAEHENNQKLEKSLAEWMSRITPDLPSLDFPTDQPRPAMQTYEAVVLYHTFDAEFVQKLSRLARETRTTNFSVLMSAFGVLLHHYTGQESVVVGCPFANRTLPETAQMFGFFVNTMPVRMDFTPGLTFAELVRQTRNFILFAIEHQSMPFKKLVEALNPPRDLSRHPVFQLVLNQVPIAYEKLESAGLTIEKLPFDDQYNPFDMELRFNVQGDGLLLTWKYNCALFSAQTIQRLLGSLDLILRDGLDSPSKPVASLQVLSAPEREHLIYGLNATRADLPASFVHESIFSQAEAAPNALAISDETRVWTYRELVSRSGQIAHALLAAGATPQTRIGVLLERSVELPAALLAVMQIGATYVPLDPIYPPERIKVIVNDAAAGIIISQETVWARNAVPGVIPLLLDSLPAAEKPSIPHLPPAPDDLVYLIYTSGSTGIPKGVGITYQNLVTQMAAAQQKIRFGPADQLLAVTTITFDISNIEMYLPLMCGGKLHIAPAETARDGSALASLITDARPTWMQATPATWKMLLAAGWPGLENLSIVCGGEALDVTLARQLLERSRAVWNGYGPTEITIYATFYQVRGDETLMPIGRPLMNYRAYILDAALEPVPPGARGILHIAGPGVALGYQNRPEQTAAAFLPDPFFPGERMYRTGDLASLLPDGNILFHGRNDFQVKIRGFRIELGEIEAALKLHPAVKDVVVIAQDHPAGNKLAAFWLPQDQANPDLRIFLQSRLPEYMIPSVFEKLEHFPLTPSGKVDRKSLAQLPVNISDLAYVRPSTELEQKLVTIWQEILRVEQVGVTDNFFDLGGHSILATVLVARVKKELGLQLSLAGLFQNNTIRAMAVLLDAQLDSHTEENIVPMQPSGDKPPLLIVTPANLGGIFYLRDLARNFAPDQPVYGVWNFSSGAISVEETAKIIANQVQRVFPKVPYYLIGHSNGGLVALATACRLVEQGQRIGFVALLDTYPPGADEKKMKLEKISLAERFKIHWQRSRQLGIIDAFKYYQLRLIVRAAHLRYRLLKSFAAPQAAKTSSSDAQKEIQPYPGKIIVFRAENNSDERKNSMKHWTKFALGGLDLIDIPGNHVSIVQGENARVLAKIIRRYLGEN